MRIHGLRERIDVRALELRELSILHEEHGELVARFRELLEYRRVGGRSRRRLLEDRKLEALEQNFAELRIRVDVELTTRGFVDLALDSPPFALEALLEGREPRDVDLYTRPFEIGEDTDERHLDVAIQLGELLRIQVWGNARLRVTRDVHGRAR
jgi:hypothetical protein